jgi:putative intracellular protease/amidase
MSRASGWSASIVARYWTASGSVAQPGAASSPTLTSAEADNIRLTTVIASAWLSASRTTLRFMAARPESFDTSIVARYRHGVNDRQPTFHAMTRQIAFLVYPGFQVLDAAGPLAAFEAANACVPGAYLLELIARDGGLVASSGGTRLAATAFSDRAGDDTLIVTGGDGVFAAAECATTVGFVSNSGAALRRIASVCSGAYLLATAGLLRRAARHHPLAALAGFQARRFPAVQVDADLIYHAGWKGVDLGRHQRPASTWRWP